MDVNFSASLALTLVYEGGWSDNPRDPGGATYQGVTQSVYDTWRLAHGLPQQSVRLMAVDERGAIYRSRYWGQSGCGALKAGLDYAVFDFSVNSGVRRSVRTLQSMVGAVADGVLGPVTVNHVDIYTAAHGAVGIISDLCTARLRFLRGLSTWVDFGRGWERRVMGAHAGPQADDTGVVDRAAAMAARSAVAAPVAPMVTAKSYTGRVVAA